VALGLLGLVLSGHTITPEAGAQEKDAEVKLFNGQDLTGWKMPAGAWQAAGSVPLDPQDMKKLVVEAGQGVLVNGPQGKTSNLLTTAQHGDIECHIEFVVPKGSNSGVYFQGRYEIQILDSYGVQEPKYSDCGGIYRDNKDFEGKAPSLNASLAPGEWQAFDVVFQAPRFDSTGQKIANAKFVKVVHNGKVIHENVEVPGPTRAAAFRDEQALGPLMLQGDHGPVAYRNLRWKALPMQK